jgi:RHS repeat-associated protein
MTDSTGTTRYRHDANGRVLTVTYPDGAALSMQYDAAGQRASMTYAGGHEISYRYDLNGRLTGLHDSRAGDAAYVVDPDGRLLTEQLPHRQARRYHYEDGLLRRFTTIRDGHPLGQTSFLHDPDGRILAERDGDRVRTYRYDRAGQLTAVGCSDREPGDGSPGQRARADTIRLAYDAAGNRVSLRRGDAQTHYRYDAADQLLDVQTGGRRTEFRYDPCGRLAEQAEDAQRRTIAYDAFGRPAEIRWVDGETVAGRIQVTFNGDGLPVGLAATAVAGHRGQERSSSVRYWWSPGEIPQILAQRAEPEIDDREREHPGRLNADFVYGYGRTFASWEDGAVTFTGDAFSSVIRTEETRPWAGSSRYDAFGLPEDDAAEGPGQWRPWELPRFGYRGELALGPMMYLGARTYDAAVGRFTTRDPVPPPVRPGDTANPYLYAGNDPVNHGGPPGTLALGFSLAATAAAVAGAVPAADIAGIVATLVPSVGAGWPVVPGSGASDGSAVGLDDGGGVAPLPPGGPAASQSPHSYGWDLPTVLTRALMPGPGRPQPLPGWAAATGWAAGPPCRWE